MLVNGETTCIQVQGYYSAPSNLQTETSMRVNGKKGKSTVSVHSLIWMDLDMSVNGEKTSETGRVVITSLMGPGLMAFGRTMFRAPV